MAFELVVVGASLGGLHALEVLLAGLPKGFPLPVAVVLHRTAEEEPSTAGHLQRHCSLPVRDAEDKEGIMPGQVYLAPPDYHLLVERGSLALSTEAPVQHARPSIDALFQSAADAYGEGAIAVVLTGASEDGAHGAARIKECGGVVVVEDPAAAESPIMPKAAIAATDAARVLPLAEIGPFLVKCSRPTGGQGRG